MNSTTGHQHLVVASLLLAVSALAAGCLSEQPFGNEEFQLTCLRFLGSGFEVTVECRSTGAWSKFPSYDINLSGKTNLTFLNCAFSPEFRFRDVLTKLNLTDVRLDTLKLEGSSSTISREQLRDIQIDTLHLLDSNVGELPKDLLQDLRIDTLLMNNVSITGIPKDFFENWQYLNYVEITDNEIKKVGATDFEKLANLEQLLLFNNDIEEIEAGAFDKLTKLRLIELSKNRLKTLPVGIFKNLSNLKRLNLGENDFEELPADLIRENKRLQLFKLNHNRGPMASLPDKFFHDVNLTEVEITNNKFTSLPPNLFYGQVNFTVLNLSNNRIISLPKRAFQNAKQLKSLWLTDNLIESIPDGIFEDANLEELYLNYNRLNNLTGPMLVGLSNVKIFDASHNNLSFIDPEIHKYMGNVEIIKVSNNHLTLEKPHVEGISIFSSLVKIVEMDISYNEVRRLFPEWSFFVNLKMLRATGNKITHLSDSSLFAFNSRMVFHFEENQIETINFTTLDKSIVEYNANNGIDSLEPKYLKVYLEDNPLKCDCKMLDFLSYLATKSGDYRHKFLKIDIGKGLKCASPSQFKDLQAMEVPVMKLKCLVISNATRDACHEPCTCWDYPGPQVLAVDCSHRNLTKLPPLIVNLQNRSIELNLTGNKLRTTPSLNRSDLVNVTVLDVSSNNISIVSLDVFSKSLRDLKLHNNSLSRLDAKVIDFVSNDSMLQKLTLHKNKWICDCEARNFLSVVQKKLTNLELHEVKCSETGRALSSMTVNELCEGAIGIIVGVSLLIAFFGVVLGGLAALYYRHQKEIKVWLYSKQWCLWFVTEDELDKDKMYDAFISYSHKDEDFVNREIVAKLEEGPRPYKLCLHYRDWLAGEWIPAQIARSVDESRRTIVVLSPNFLESVWGRMEFRTAHSQALSEGRARVIVILYGDIGNTDDLDAELKAYLNMNTYVKWGDPWFWDKLRYALPHRYDCAKRRSRNARIIEKHMSNLPVNNHDSSGKSEIIPLPKLNSSNDSTKLLASGVEDDRNVLV